MSRKTIPTIKYYVTFFCCLILFFLHCVFLFAQDSQSTLSSFIPSHEAEIRMIAVHNDFLYVLDANALLTITKISKNYKSQRIKSSFDSYRVLHRKYAVRDAMFSYPYIVFTNTAGMLYVYNIAQRYMAFSALYKQGTSYTFSPSKRLFSYVDESGFIVVSTKTWAVQHEYVIDEIPSYSAISKTEKNVMLYDSRGTIVYKNIYTGEVIKRIATVDALQHLVMNSSRRFAVGISGNSLSVVDLVNGKMVNTIVISSFPTRIFTLQNSHKVASLSMFSDNSQILKLFGFSNDGQLVEKDILSIENTEHVSMVFAEEKKLYIGFEDGSLSVYNMRDQTLKSVLFDKTIANYDVMISQNTIFFANTDGLRSIALSSLVKDSSRKNLIPQFTSQMLISPMFASSVASQSLPYVVSRARTIPLLFALNHEEDGQVNFLPPIRLSFLPSIVVANSTSLFAYSQQFAKGSLLYTPRQMLDTSKIQKSQLQENSSEDADSMPEISKDFLINYPSFVFHFDDNSMLFTSAPLHEQADEKTASSNFLYAYRVSKKKFGSSQKKDKVNNSFFIKEYMLELPFSMEDILYIRHIPSQSSRRFILVRKTFPRQKNNTMMEFLLIDYVIKDDAVGKATHIGVLAREKYDEDALFLYQISEDNIKIITLACDTIFLTTAHADTGNAISHTLIPYPHKFSRTIRAHITGSLLTAVDVNNVAFVAEISDFFIAITWLMILTEMNNGSVNVLAERLR